MVNTSNKPEMARLARYRKTLEKVVRVLEYGETKHGDDQNWRNYPASKDFDAAFRHLLKIEDEVHDEETGQHHAVHAIARLLFAVEKDNL